MKRSATTASLCAIYGRVSTSHQNQCADRQLTNVHEVMAQQGVAEPPPELVFLDEDVSGTKSLDKRPEGARLLARLRDRRLPKITTLYIDDPSRLSRERGQYAWTKYLAEFEELGVRAYFVQQRIWSDDPNAQIYLSLEFRAATKFSEDLSRKTAGALLKLAARGVHCGGRPPYGFDRLLCDGKGTPLARFVLLDDGTLVECTLDGQETRRTPPTIKDGRLKTSWVPKTREQVVIPTISMVAERVETVRKIFNLYRSGKSRNQIADALNADRIPTPAETRPTSEKLGWDITSVGKILTNKKYRGSWWYGRTGQGTFHRNARGTKGEVIPQSVGQDEPKTRINKPEDVVTVEMPELAIIEPEVFEACRARLKSRRPPFLGGCSAKRDKSQFLLTSLVRCANCRGSMSGRVVDRKRPRRYTCNRWSRNKSFCLHNSVDADRLDTFVMKEAVSWLTGIDEAKLRAALLDSLKRQEAASPVQKDEAAAIRQELAAIETRRKALLANCQTSGLSPTFMRDLSAMVDGLDADATRLRQRQAELDAVASSPAPRRTARETVSAIMTERDALLEHLDSTDLPTRKAALRAVVQEVRIESARVKLEHTELRREVVIPQKVTIVRLGTSSEGAKDPVPCEALPWALG